MPTLPLMFQTALFRPFAMRAPPRTVPLPVNSSPASNAPERAAMALRRAART
ncbi:MAG: hypothetical protein ABIF82_01895 [Planctomycetota bacterium]